MKNTENKTNNSFKQTRAEDKIAIVLAAIIILTTMAAMFFLVTDTMARVLAYNEPIDSHDAGIDLAHTAADVFADESGASGQVEDTMISDYIIESSSVVLHCPSEKAGYHSVDIESGKLYKNDNHSSIAVLCTEQQNGLGSFDFAVISYIVEEYKDEVFAQMNLNDGEINSIIPDYFVQEDANITNLPDNVCINEMSAKLTVNSDGGQDTYTIIMYSFDIGENTISIIGMNTEEIEDLTEMCKNIAKNVDVVVG